MRGDEVFWSVATVLCYTASSLGDKFISAKLRCNSAEFAFLVGLSTAVFLALIVPFMGWRFSFTWQACAAAAGLTLLKLAEFYTSAILLRQVSAYELKAWLSLNVLFSFFVDLARGEAVFFPAFALCAVVMLIGILLIARGGGKRGGSAIALCLIYIASKFAYGFQMNALPGGTSSLSALIVVMLLVALAQLPFLRFRQFFAKKGLVLGALTRIPNAAGLLTEAFAAASSLLLYALVQPMQLALLFAAALAARERQGVYKIVGTLFTLAAVCAVTVCIYYYGRGL